MTERPSTTRKTMNSCKYWDCGWCYAPNDVKTNNSQGECVNPECCPYLKSQMTETLDIQKVKNLLPRHVCYINWYEEGGGEVHRSADRLFLYCIPQYGGEGHLVGEFDFNEEGIKALVKEANSWS